MKRLLDWFKSFLWRRNARKLFRGVKQTPLQQLLNDVKDCPQSHDFTWDPEWCVGMMSGSATWECATMWKLLEHLYDWLFWRGARVISRGNRQTVRGRFCYNRPSWILEDDPDA